MFLSDRSNPVKVDLCKTRCKLRVFGWSKNTLFSQVHSQVHVCHAQTWIEEYGRPKPSNTMAHTHTVVEIWIKTDLDSGVRSTPTQGRYQWPESHYRDERGTQPGLLPMNVMTKVSSLRLRMAAMPLKTAFWSNPPDFPSGRDFQCIRKCCNSCLRFLQVHSMLSLSSYLNLSLGSSYLVQQEVLYRWNLCEFR